VCYKKSMVTGKTLTVMRRSCHVFAFALLSVFAIALSAQNPSTLAEGCRFHDDPTDCKDAFAFFHKLKAAVSANQRESVAIMVGYPLRVSIDNKPVRIATPQSFLDHYDEIVNPAERCAITTSQDSDVWGNWQGYTIDRGAVWWEKSAGKDDEEPGQEIDWTRIPFKLHSFNNINVMTEGCTKFNVVQTLLPNSPGNGKGIVIVDFLAAEAFFSRFQKAVTNNEREKVADMALFPVNLRVGGKRLVAKDKVRFLQLYNSAFLARARSLLLDEHGRDLTVWWEGISDTNALVRFAPVSRTKEFLITQLADSPPKQTTTK
jgi:hypothetical protein